MCLLTKRKIILEELLHTVRSKRYGGIALFLGVVRNRSEDLSHRKHFQRVVHLEYSTYDKMALKKMKEIENKILQKWGKKGIGKVAMVHRLGKLSVGEISVGVAVSAVHRRESLESCRYAIEQIKKSVPIFKKEFFSNNKSFWIGC